jgi:hypothetical protein
MHTQHAPMGRKLGIFSRFVLQQLGNLDVDRISMAVGSAELVTLQRQNNRTSRNSLNPISA